LEFWLAMGCAVALLSGLVAPEAVVPRARPAPARIDFWINARRFGLFFKGRWIYGEQTLSQTQIDLAKVKKSGHNPVKTREKEEE